MVSLINTWSYTTYTYNLLPGYVLLSPTDMIYCICTLAFIFKAGIYIKEYSHKTQLVAMEVMDRL